MYLKINNKKIDIIIAKSFFQRLSGLMSKTNIDYGMLFKKCNSIHTFFMKEDIDIIGLNEKNKVIYKYERLSKNKIIKVKKKLINTSILELPGGSSKSISIGDIIIFHK